MLGSNVSIFRSFRGLGLGAVAVLGGGLVWYALAHGPQPRARQFVPGALGYEAGAPAPAPGPGAFLTRAFSMPGDGQDGRRWQAANQVAGRLQFSHNLHRVFPPALSASHPEFFPLIGGARLKPAPKIIDWNPDLGREDVARHAAEVAADYFSAHPADRSFSLGTNDGLLVGESPETLALTTPVKWFRGRPDYAPLVFTFMNRAAAELGRTYPDKYLGCLAYYWAENTPGFPLNRQVVPFLTTDRSQGYDSALREQEYDLQRRWAAVAGEHAGGGPRRLGLYDYLYGGGFLIPRIHTRLLAENLRRARQAGFTDYYAEVYPNWGLDGPMPWLAAQLALDPAQPLEPLLDEYYARYFREAAGPMRAFFTRCEEQWMRQPGPGYWLKHYRNESQADIFPLAVCRELRAQLTAAAQAAKSARVRDRVALVSEAFGVTERFVAMQEAREALNRRALRPGRDWRGLVGALWDFRAARDQFESYAKSLRQRQPLALRPFLWEDYLRHDPMPGAVVAIQTAAEASGEFDAAETLVRNRGDEAITHTWLAALVSRTRTGLELVRNGGLHGPVLPARQIAGLPYGLALPAEWGSKVEPTEFQHAELTGQGPGGRVLHIAGSADSALFQWCPMPQDYDRYAASVAVRGRVSPGTAVMLTIGWLDRNGKNLGSQVVRLPEGETGDWVELNIIGAPPPQAVRVGVGLRVLYQVAGDWAEARDFSLQAIP